VGAKNKHLGLARKGLRHSEESFSGAQDARDGPCRLDASPCVSEILRRKPPYLRMLQSFPSPAQMSVISFGSDALLSLFSRVYVRDNARQRRAKTYVSLGTNNRKPDLRVYDNARFHSSDLYSGASLEAVVKPRFLKRHIQIFVKSG
jgi:hypothetical protein